jgi:hypothetical protein
MSSKETWDDLKSEKEDEQQGDATKQRQLNLFRIRLGREARLRRRAPSVLEWRHKDR